MSLYIMFSGHYYNSGTDLESKAKSLNWYRTKFGVGVAVYVGEFNPDAFSSPNFSTEVNNYNINYISDDEIKTFYQKLWTEKYLSTKNFTLNTTLQSYLK